MAVNLRKGNKQDVKFVTVKLINREDAGKTDKVDIPVRFHAREH